MLQIKITIFFDPSTDLLPVIYAPVYEPCTLLDIRNKYAASMPLAELTLNGVIYNNDDLGNTQVPENAEIIIKPYPGFWIQLGAFIWTVGTQIALAVAISYLGGLMFGQNPPESGDANEGTGDQSFGFNPKSTQREGITIPLAYGKNMHHGNIVSRWTNINDEDNEVLFLKICYGEGPTEGIDTNAIYINNQPIGFFENDVVHQRVGTDNQTVMPGFEQEKIEIRNSDEITYDAGSKTYNLPRKGFDQIEFTLGFDRGLYHYTKMGDQNSHALTVKVEISVVGLNSWTTLISTPITRNQTGAYYIEYSTEDSSIAFTPDRTKQYQLRVAKLSADQDKAKYGDELRLRSFRGVVNTAFTHPGKALMGLQIAASDLLNGAIDVKVVREDRILRWYNGSSWALGYKSNRAWVAYNMLTQPSITGDGDGTPFDIEFYEGFQPSRLDTAFFYEWALLCDTQVDDGNGNTIALSPCHHIIDSAVELWNMVYQLATIGRARLIWEGTTLSGWIDSAVTGDLEIITSDIIIGETWTQEWTTSPNKVGTIHVDYQDEDRGYKRIKWPYSNESSGSYTNTIDIRGVGIKNRALATYVAAYTLERSQLLLELNSCVMYKDALMYKIGEVYLVQVNQPNWGQSYRIEDSDSSTGNEITLDRDVDASNGDTIYIRSYVPSTGAVTTKSYTVDSVVDDVVTLTTGLADAVARKDIVAIGTTLELKKRRIISKQWNPDHTFTITFEQYDPDLFDIFDITPTVDYPDYTPAFTENRLAEPVSEFDVTNLIQNLLPPQLAVDIPWTSNLTWAHSGSGGVASWEATDGTNPILFRLEDATSEIDEDNTDKEFIYWDPNFVTLFRVTDDINVAIASGNWLMAVNTGSEVHAAHGMQLIHAGVLLAGTIRAEQYAQLRQTMPWTYADSCDASHTFIIDFKIPSETDDIISVKLSFKIKVFRTYLTGTGVTPQSADTLSSDNQGFNEGSLPVNWSHAHTVYQANHSHDLILGIYEEDNSPVTLHYNVDNGSGFGASSGDFTGDQTDIEIVSVISGTGWKAVRFTVDKRCRIVASVEVKVDVTA